MSTMNGGYGEGGSATTSSLPASVTMGRKHLKIWQDNQSCRTIWFCSVRSDPATCKTRQLGQGFAQGSGLFVAVLDSILTGERVVTRRRQSITEPPD